jgi:mycothiol system anti-sigma-R factor
MNCRELIDLLHAYLDQELDVVRSLEIEQHLKVCSACSQRYQAQQALRRLIAGRSLYFEAPRGLGQTVDNAIRQASQTESPPARWTWDLGLLWLRWLVPVAAAALVMVVALPWLVRGVRGTAEDHLAQEVASAHVRSLLANHLTDVASTDQHTVKPWFSGKLSFAPSVTELATDGFPLVGGRLDVLEGQPVAAVVYQCRKHFINLFIWPSALGADVGEKSLAQRGYNLVHWTRDGMNYWAVSDVNRSDLEEFAKLVREVLGK